MMRTSTTRILAALLVLALGLALLAACGGDDDDGDSGAASSASSSASTSTASDSSTSASTSTSTSSSSSTTAPASAPTAVPSASGSASSAPKTPVIDHVIIGAQQPSRLSNNVGRGLSPQAQIQLVPMYEYMIGTDAQSGALIPQLATGWSVEPNGIDFRIQLRDGVPFHNNTGTLSWRDVERTVMEFGAEDSEHTHARNYRTVTIEPVNDLEFIWKLPGPLAEQVRRLSEQVGGMEIMSSTDYDATGPPQMTTAPTTGTGAYEFDERTQTVGISFNRVSYAHWRYTPDFETLELRWMNEESTRLAALLAEEIHITQLGADSTERAAKDGMKVETGTLPGARIFGSFQGGYLDITDRNYEATGSPCGYVHCGSPFLNPLVRKAMNKAIDKDTLNEAFFRSAAQNMFIQAIPITSAAFNPAWEANYEAEYGYDPQAARALLAQAGYNENNPLEINVNMGIVAAYPQAQDVKESMAGMWQDVGIKPSLQTVDAAVQRPRSRSLQLENWTGLTATASFDVQSWRVHHAAISPRGGGFEPRETYELIKELQQTMDTGDQDDLLRRIGDIAHPLHVAVNLFWVPPQIVVNPKYIESWEWPGNVSGLWSHFNLIKGARE